MSQKPLAATAMLLVSVGTHGQSASWEELRRGAVARGITLSLVYDGEGLANTTGGIRTGRVYLG